MSERWNEYLRNKQHELIELKKRLEITIYGSYHPRTEFFFLRDQRDFLIKRGFEKTRLVVDFPNPNELNSLEISKDCLQHSDLNFLFFTRNGRGQGVVRELTHVATSSTMRNKITDCIVIEQVEESRRSVPSLSQNDIRTARINRRAYRSNIQLKKILVYWSSWQLRRLKNELLLR